MNPRITLLILALCSVPITCKPKMQRWNATQYAQNSSPQFTNATKELHRLNLKGTESVLDVGCGNGQLAAYILEKYLPYGTIHGIDASAQQIEHAKEAHTKNNRLSFEQANVLTYQPTQQYDVVISFWVLHWVKDYEKALRTIYKALKPGGKALIGQLAENELILSQEVKKLMQESPWSEYCTGYEFPIHSFPLDQITRAARSAGFTIEYVQLINEQEVFKNSTEYANHYQALPVSGCIPAKQKEQFFSQAMQRALTREPRNANGSIVVNGYATYLLLKKPA